jgi:hypothetical protein
MYENTIRMHCLNVHNPWNYLPDCCCTTHTLHMAVGAQHRSSEAAFIILDARGGRISGAAGGRAGGQARVPVGWTGRFRALPGGQAGPIYTRTDAASFIQRWTVFLLPGNTQFPQRLILGVQDLLWHSNIHITTIPFSPKYWQFREVRMVWWNKPYAQVNVAKCVFTTAQHAASCWLHPGLNAMQQPCWFWLEQKENIGNGVVARLDYRHKSHTNIATPLAIYVHKRRGGFLNMLLVVLDSTTV